MSLALFGAFVGALIAGPISDKIGRRSTILVSDVLFTAGSSLMCLAPTIKALMAGRVVVGLAIGICSMVVPVYLSEISPKEVRGTIVGIYIAVLCAG